MLAWVFRAILLFLVLLCFELAISFKDVHLNSNLAPNFRRFKDVSFDFDNVYHMSFGNEEDVVKGLENRARRSIRRANPQQNKILEGSPNTGTGVSSTVPSFPKKVSSKQKDSYAGRKSGTPGTRSFSSLSNQQIVLKLKDSKNKWFQRQLLEALASSNAPLKHYHYPIVLKCAGFCGDYKKLNHFFEQMEQNGQGTPYAYTSFMSASGRLGKYYEALGIFRKMQAEGMEIRKETYRCIICTLKKSGQWYIALDLLKEMAREGFADNPSFNAVMDVCIKCGEWHVAFGLLDQAQTSYGVTPDVITFTSAIAACTSSRNLRQALFLFDRMQREGVEPNEYTYTALISTCEKEGNTDKALELLNQMKNEGVAPNVYTYSAAISACGKGKRFEEALSLFQEMKDNGIQPNAFTYSGIILACEALGPNGWKYSLQLLEDMHEDGLQPDDVCYHSAMQMCRDAGKDDQVIELLREMRLVGLKPSDISYNIVISCFERDERLQEAVAFLKEMESEGIRPTLYSFNSCIIACGAQHLLALGMLKEVLKRGISPTAYTYSLVIMACLKAQKPKQAQNVIWEMKKKGVEVDTVCFNTCLTACMRGENWQAALALAKEMKAFDNVEMDIVSYNILISACEKGGQAELAKQLFDEMEDECIEPDVISYSTVISAFEKAADWKAALAMLEKMKANGIEPNVYSYSAAISACEKGGQWEASLQLWDEMVKMEIQPNVVSYSAIIASMEKAGKLEKVKELYADGYKKGIIKHWSDRYPGLVDFHDFTVPMSKAALRKIFEDILRGTSTYPSDKDLILITGIGNRSKHGISVIKPALQSLLSTEFTPPLYALEMSKNPGRLVIAKENINSWIMAQKTGSVSKCIGDSIRKIQNQE